MRLVFFGTPEPAVVCLDALASSAHELVAVVTAPDRPSGRGMQTVGSPVKRRATDLGLQVLQPESLKNAEALSQLAQVAQLRGAEADVFVVVAYGLLLPKAVLDMPLKACVNVHFSLLPKLRGAAPVQWAIIEGHTLTGVSVMKMDEGMDTGPVFDQVEVPILGEDNSATLGERLGPEGASLLIKVLDAMEIGGAEASPQSDELASYAPKITPVDARIDWSHSASSLTRRIRGLSPKPGAWTMFHDRRLKIFKAAEIEEPSASPPGSVDELSKDMLVVSTGSNGMMLTEVQPEGRSRMSAGEFIAGYRPSTGDTFV